MAKIALDKFYTPDALASYCVQKALEVIGKDRITEFVEPSAGAGAFLPYLKATGIPYLAYDIAPEGEGIIQADFLSLPMLYKRGRCFIGNPPFRYTFKIGGKFYRRACQLGDFIAFILPINSLGGTPELSYFDLIFSERLPVTEYSGYPMKCCLNIYERPASGVIRTARAQLGNRRIRFRAFCRGEDRADYIPDGYFLAFCSFGSVGKPSHLSASIAKRFTFTVMSLTFRERFWRLRRKMSFCLIPLRTAFQLRNLPLTAIGATCKSASLSFVNRIARSKPKRRLIY